MANHASASATVSSVNDLPNVMPWNHAVYE